jgi:hypothetical protein
LHVSDFATVFSTSVNKAIPAGTIGTIIRVVRSDSGTLDSIRVDFGVTLNPDKLISMSQAAEQIVVVSDSVRTRFHLFFCVCLSVCMCAFV